MGNRRGSLPRAGTSPVRALGHDGNRVGDSGTEAVLAAVLDVARPGRDDRIVGLGAGGGSLLLPLASVSRSVLAIDSVPLEELHTEAAARGVDNLHVHVAELPRLRMPFASADVIVSCDAMRHLPNHDKRALLVRARRWLRPGGRIVVAEKMSGWDESPAGVPAAATAGPGSRWRRVGRHVILRGLGVDSGRPASPEFWRRALTDAGFRDVGYRRVTADDGLAWGSSPGAAEVDVADGA